MQFIHPEYFLLLLLIPLMVAGAILTSRKHSRRIASLIAGRLRSILCNPRCPRQRWYALASFMTALTLLIFALASPSAGLEEYPGNVKGRNIMIAIDVSRSMFAEDVKPNRFHAAKASALELLDRFPNDRIGIITFSGTAWIQAPLTVDHNALRDTLQQLDHARSQGNDWIPRDGSDLASAVRLATKTLHETGQQENTLIILSDGETHYGGIAQAAHEANRAGTTIFSAGFGTKQGAFIPHSSSPDGHFHDREGNLVITRLESKPLHQLAETTGGVYSEGAGRNFLSKLEITIQRIKRFEFAGRMRRIATPHFQWFLAPSMLLFAVGIFFNSSFRFQRGQRHPSPESIAPLPGKIPSARPPSLLTIALGLCFLLLASSVPAEARFLPRTAAERALGKGDHEQALALFEREILKARGERKSRLQLGAATAAYRLGKYRSASQSYSGALLSRDKSVQEQAHFGLGNTHYYKGLHLKRHSKTIENIPLHWRDSISHFTEVLILNPDNREAAENRDHVEEQLAKWLNNKKHEGPIDPSDPPNENPPKKPEQSPEKNPPEKNPPEKKGSQSTPAPDNNNATSASNQPSIPPDTDSKDEDLRPPASDSEKPRPGESPEEFARRILRDNADFELRLLPRKSLGAQRAKKDW